MDSLLKSGEKDKAKKFYSKFQSILMQVAKSGVVNKKTASRKISRVSKKIKKYNNLKLIKINYKTYI